MEGTDRTSLQMLDLPGESSVGGSLSRPVARRERALVPRTAPGRRWRIPTSTGSPSAGSCGGGGVTPILMLTARGKVSERVLGLEGVVGRAPVDCERRALGDALPARFHLAHPRTLRRWVLMRDADLILTPSHLLVVLAFTKRPAWLRSVLQRFNTAEVALPWLGGRRVVMGFAAQSQPLSDAGLCCPMRAKSVLKARKGAGALVLGAYHGTQSGGAPVSRQDVPCGDPFESPPRPGALARGRRPPRGTRARPRWPRSAGVESAGSGPGARGRRRPPGKRRATCSSLQRARERRTEACDSTPVGRFKAEGRRPWRHPSFPPLPTRLLGLMMWPPESEVAVVVPGYDAGTKGTLSRPAGDNNL